MVKGIEKNCGLRIADFGFNIRHKAQGARCKVGRHESES